MTADARITLQNLVFPDAEICPEPTLYARVKDRGVLGIHDAPLLLLSGGRADFETYFNLLNLGTLMRNAELDGLRLMLEGRGRVALEVRLSAGEGYADAALHREVHRLDGGVTVDLAHAIDAAAERGRLGLVSFALTALDEEVTLTGGRYSTGPAARRRDPRIALSITTFRREAEVARTMARLEAFLGDHPLGRSVRAFVVDNGQSVAAPSTAHVEVIPNPNLGGAGGFARGLAEARAQGFSHCLFMDDDASFPMENLVRTHAFLSIATSDKAAVAGAMIAGARPHLMWENGAVFDRVCRPRSHGADLRERKELRRMEIDAAQDRPARFYAGWWYFAFPVAAAARDPFPFFVRGDDSSFSLANQFDSVTLPGVVAFQEDFFAKETPLVSYLDARYHLHHHLVHPMLDIGWRGTVKVMARLMARNLMRFHYEAAEAQLLAWEDVMRGPSFFEENVDMAERRAVIGAMTCNERFAPLADPGALPPAGPEPKGRTRSDPAVWSLNGHLLPGFRLLAGAATVPIARRGALAPAWGHHRLTYLSADGGSGYTVSLDRARFARIALRAAKLAMRWRRAYPRLRDAHRAGYVRLASPEFWAEHRLDAPKAAA